MPGNKREMDDTRPDQDKGIPKKYGGHVGSRDVSTLGFDELNGKRGLLKYLVTCGGRTYCYHLQAPATL